jgi:hypothetical protein
MVCFRSISVNTLHKGDGDDDNNNNNNKTTRILTHVYVNLLLVLIQSCTERDANCLKLKFKDVTYPYMHNYGEIKGQTTSEEEIRELFSMAY